MERITRNNGHDPSRLATRGLNGIHADGIGDDLCPKWSLTYYTDTWQQGPFQDLEEGGFAIDKKELLATSGEARSMVVNGPMVDITLAPGSIDKFDLHENAELMLPGLGGGYKTLAARAVADRSWTGLDSMSLDLYVAMWRELGARIGQRRGNDIEWEDGEIEKITECSR